MFILFFTWLVEVIREQERYMPIRSLYIANDEGKSGNSFLTINGASIKPILASKRKIYLEMLASASL